jgi:trehalose 6-phosphate phosphatase
MKPLFTPNGLKILESLTFTRTLFAFDFDGTLSKIVPLPSNAQITPSVARLLVELSQFAPIAIISGRSIADLKERLPFTPKYLIGNHGSEGLAMRNEVMKNAQCTCQLWKAELDRIFRHAACFSGLEIEDKTYSIAIHYRRSPSKKKAKIDILNALVTLDPKPRIVLGKSVVNLIPAGAPHKGVALMELMIHEGVHSAFYAGDDDTDEDVFTLPNSRILTVRVGQRRTSQAQYYVQKQNEMTRLLKTLVAFYHPASQGTHLKGNSPYANI